MACAPCNYSAVNTDPANETLPSALSNFIDDFYGNLTKTAVDGRVNWELPCGLDTGIESNPRQEGEGLACYLKRIVEESAGSPVYATRAALESVAGFVDGQTAWVERYAVNQEWGGPRIWKWDADSTEVETEVCRKGGGGSVGRWKHTWDDGDVRVFGLVGDGVVDCTSGFVAAVAQAKVQKLQLKFPAGVFKLTGTIDLRNSSDNVMEFGGVKGAGITLTEFKAYHDDPIFLLRGRGGRYEGFHVKYDSQRDETKTNANILVFYGFVYYMTFRSIEATLGYRGLYSDTGSSGIFSCSFDDVVVRNISYRHVEVQNSTGNRWGNVYLGNQGALSADIMLVDRAGSSAYQQINFEHCNIRTSAIRIRGDSAQFQHLHFEGIRMLTDGPLIDVGGVAVDISSMKLINCYGAGHYISSITTAGVATVNLLGQAVQGHGFRVGDSVTIAGASDAAYNGTFTISAATATTFTIPVAGPPAAPAVPNYTIGGSADWIWCYLGSYPSPVLFVSSAYGNSKVHVGSLVMRNNKIQSSTSAGRNGWGWLVAREFGGKLSWVDVDYLIQGSQYRGGDNQIGYLPIVASSRTSNVTTVWFQFPHELQQGQYVSFSGGANLNFGSNYAQVASVPSRYSATFALTGANAGLTLETANLIPIRARIVSYSRSSDIATVVTDVDHNFQVGNRVLIRSMSVGDFSSAERAIVAVPSSNSFSYVSIGVDVASTIESSGHVFEFSSGLTAALQSSATVGLIRIDRYFKPLVCLPSETVLAGATSTHSFTVNGVRIGDPVSARLYATPPSGLEIDWVGVVANDQVQVVLYNRTGGSLVLSPSLLWLDIQR